MGIYPCVSLEIPQPIKNDIEPNFIPVVFNDDETLWAFSESFREMGEIIRRYLRQTRILFLTDLITSGKTLRFTTDLIIVASWAEAKFVKSPSFTVDVRIISQFTT